MSLFAAWRDAEQAATQAELALSSALRHGDSHPTAAPGQDRINDVARMRALADQEHCKALGEIHNRLHRPSGNAPVDQPSRSA